MDKVADADYHKQEWLFYQSIAWEAMEMELNKFENEKWGRYYKSDPKKLWQMLDWKGEIKSQKYIPPNIIHSYFEAE